VLAGLTVTASLLSGCYTYTPVPVDLVPAGQDVRLTVNRQGAGDLADELSLDGAAPVLIGQVTGREASSLLLRVPFRSDATGGAGGVDLAQMARVPLDQILGAELRQLSTGRTAGFVAGVAGAATLLLLKIIDATGSNPGDGGDDPVLAIIRLPIG
jgi:hypothetical protein